MTEIVRTRTAPAPTIAKAPGFDTRRWPRRVAIASGTLGALVIATTAAGGWYYADELLQVRPDPKERPIEVLAVSGGMITLRGEGADEPGLTGLEWDDGYARIGPDVTKTADGDVVRSLTPFPDRPPVGTHARVDFYAVPVDLAAVSDFAVEPVVFGGPLGPYPATFVPGEGTRWVVHVHGRGANRAEAYRMVPTLQRLGYPQLAISYRNDTDAPADPDGQFGLGWTESADLSAALDHARAEGAKDFVLVGYSMGGAIVGNYLRTYGSADIAAAIYDSPALSWADILAFQARERSLPEAGGALAALVVRLRTGIRLGEMDQVVHADRLDVPVLLFHGTGDATVPVVTSDAYAAARPDLITYVRTEGAGHVQSWNAGPEAYAAAVEAFLAGLH